MLAGKSNQLSPSALMSASTSTFVLIPSFCTLQGRIQNVFGLKMDGFLDDFVAQAVYSSAMLGIFYAI